jgi:hypothetical protein
LLPGDVELQASAVTAVPELRKSDNVSTLSFVANGAPTVEAKADSPLAVEGSSVSLTASASDPNADPLTLQWSQNLDGAPRVSLDGADGPTASFDSPSIDVETVLCFTAAASDPDGLWGQDDVCVEILPLNDPPVAIAGPDQRDVPEGREVTLAGTATDRNQDPLMVQWLQVLGPAVILDMPQSATTTFSLPDIRDPTVFRFRFRVVDDEGGVGTDFVEVHAVRVNQEPAARASAPSPVLEIQPVILDATASVDPDEDPLSYLWAQKSGPAVELDDPTAVMAGFLSPETPIGEILEFELQVADGFGGSDTTTVSVAVVPDPSFPAVVEIRATPRSALSGLEATISLEVEVLARHPSLRVADGTQVELSTSLGHFLGEASPTSFVGATRLGLFTAALVPGSVPGDAVVVADVLGASTQGTATLPIATSPDEVGHLFLSLEPPAVVAGGAPVRLLTRVVALDEDSGAVPDGTEVAYSASAGSLPSGMSANTVGGVAIGLLEPPSSPGLVHIVASVAGRSAAATLRVVADEGALGGTRLVSDAPSVVAGGGGTLVRAVLEPALFGGSLGASSVTFSVDLGLVDGLPEVSRDTQPLGADIDRSPLRDFPGPDDDDLDVDGRFDLAGRRVAEVRFSHPGAVAEPRLASVSVNGASLPILVLPDGSDPGALFLAATPGGIEAGGEAATIEASVERGEGGLVSDGVSVRFNTSSGLATPVQATTLDGRATTQVEEAEPFPLTKRLRLDAVSGAVSETLHLNVVPGALDPAALDFALRPSLVPSDGESEATLRAVVTRLDRSQVPDGTRVLFDVSAGIPSSLWAETLDGVAEITVASDIPGEFEAHARLAGSVISAVAHGSFLELDTARVVLSLNVVSGVGSITGNLSYPEGALPLPGNPGVAIEAVPANQGGIAGGGMITLGNDLGESILFAVIDSAGLNGPGELVRLLFAVPPGSPLGCGEFDFSPVELTDLDGFPLAGATLDCVRVELP